MEKILVETSAKHIHLSQADLEALFGEGYELTKFKDLSQPGQYAAEEKVTVVGPRSEATMRVLGPVRKESQVELAATDARGLGFKAPVRESGDLDGTPGCVLRGPKGEITIDKGVIIAKRHIHFSTKDAKHFGVENGQIVSVKVETADRSLTFGDVVCRVSDKYALAMHIDTDEANAAGAPKEGEIIK